MAGFSLMFCTSIFSKLYSVNQYNKYLKATDQTASDRFYRNANVGQRIALISAGFAISFHALDTYFTHKKISSFKKYNPEIDDMHDYINLKSFK
jgi:hypothetical protein